MSGDILLDDNGEALREPGLFKSVKGIGWFIDEYGIAQISYNLTNINISPLHLVFEKTCERAVIRGMRVTGSELIGLVPKKVLVDAGKYFLSKQGRSIGIPEIEIIKIAIKSLGLNELSPFNPSERIIEYILDSNKDQPLINMTLNNFANETSSESPAPGGGSISAYCGAMGVALGTMVANLSAHKRGWDDKWEKFSDWAEKGIVFQNQLLNLVDEDTKAFNNIMYAFRLPKDSKLDKEIRNREIQKATKFAILTPYSVMKTAYESMHIMKAMVEFGNPNSITDAGVGALCARTAVMGAFLNVKINCCDYQDKLFVKDILQKGEELVKKTQILEDEILKITNNNIN